MMRMKTVMFKRTAVTVGLMTLLWLLCTLTIPGHSHAAIFFDSDFESCAVGTADDFPCDGWNDFGQANPGHLEVTNSIAFSGTKSVKGTFDNVAGSSSMPSIWKRFPDTAHYFMRVATRQSPGFQRGNNGHTKMIRHVDAAGGYPSLLLMYSYGQYAIIMEGPYDAGTYSLFSGVTPSSTSWDQVEIEWKLNTPGQSNGLCRMWVNGVLRIEQLNKQYVGPTPTSRGAAHGLLNPSTLRVMQTQIFIQSGLGNIYYDRLATGDTRIGPAQAKSTSADSTPPASPQGLQVR